jgi:hypothetical protein
MMAKKYRAGQQLIRSPANRVGEGSSTIDTIVQTFVSTDGKSVTQLGVDLSKADVPDRRYAADTCAVAYVHQTVRIIFGQERFDAEGLRTAIVVKMTPRSVVQFLKMIDSTMSEAIVEGVRQEGMERQALASPKMEPSQATVVLAANLGTAALNSLESCIDFYEASPFAFGVALQQGSGARLAVEPVVRVDLTSGLLFSLLDELRRIKSDFAGIKFMEPRQ